MPPIGSVWISPAGNRWVVTHADDDRTVWMRRVEPRSTLEGWIFLKDLEKWSPVLPPVVF